MVSEKVELPLIDLNRYINPVSAEDQEAVVQEVLEACKRYGFFQVKGHGIPLSVQNGLIKALKEFFTLPKEDKLALSFLKNKVRRGYENSGDTLRQGDKLPDSKEAFYIGREEPEVERFHGPNIWPNLPADKFKNPVWEYFEATHELGRLIWEICLRSLGHPKSLLESFTTKPVVIQKMIRYPPASITKAGQFGVGPHTDFGGVTVLLQEPEKEGLEVWDDDTESWMSVPSIEDVFIINMGDMIRRWSGGVFRSAKHRVINKADTDRYSSATFWHGDLETSNPLDLSDPDRDTIYTLLKKRFGKQFSLPKDQVPETAVGA